MGIAAVSTNHGICRRHEIKQLKDVGIDIDKVPQRDPPIFDPDLKNLPPEDLELAQKITAIRRMKTVPQNLQKFTSRFN
jgi:hypothetical protein